MMRRRISGVLVLPVLLSALAGCESVKSANPTSPSVAGPIAGVNITTPHPVAPPQGVTIAATEQPITLTVNNAATNGQRAVTYVFEVASDSGFEGKVVTRDGVEPGAEGKTSFRLPDALSPDRTYYWRAKAVDGANESTYSVVLSFEVITPVIIQAPVPISPVSGATISSLRPTFKTANAVRSGPVGAISYVFDIASNQAFSNPVAVVTVAEQGGQTKFTLAQELTPSTKYYWRVKAYDPNVTSDWSLTQSFRTPEPTVVVPGPTGPTTPAPPSSGWPRNGDELVRWATATYPDRLVAGVSLSQRQANMAFIRDRMIEAGTCGGMRLAWNLKRGGPEKSIDYLAYNKTGAWIGVDIGYAYDDTSQVLQLAWAEGDSYMVYPLTYTPAPSCK